MAEVEEKDMEEVEKEQVMSEEEEVLPLVEVVSFPQIILIGSIPKNLLLE